MEARPTKQASSLSRDICPARCSITFNTPVRPSYSSPIRCISVFFLLVFFLFLLCGCRPVETREVTARQFKVLRVIDGDTFVVHYDNEPTSVRIIGINAPERRDPGGPAATAKLRELIANRQVRLTFSARRKRDNFGRLLARVHIDDLEVGAEMIRTGNANIYRKGQK